MLSYKEEKQLTMVKIQTWCRNIGIGLALTATVALAGCPQYNVYSQTLAGEARLRESESSRQIAIQEAKATRESAQLLAEAEIIRARGVAESNRIVADGLGGPEGYLRYLFIQQVGDNDNQIIYLPTEAGVPILEAGKRNN